MYLKQRIWLLAGGLYLSLSLLGAFLRDQHVSIDSQSLVKEISIDKQIYGEKKRTGKALQPQQNVLCPLGSLQKVEFIAIQPVFLPVAVNRPKFAFGTRCIWIEFLFPSGEEEGRGGQKTRILEGREGGEKAGEEPRYSCCYRHGLY